MNRSRVKRLALLLLGLAAVPLRAANSWEDEKAEWEKVAGSRFYKDPGYAAKLALSLYPVDLGHFYVGEVGKGVWSSVGQTVSLAALALPVLDAQSRSRREKDKVWTGGMISMAAAGGLGYLALKVWSAFDAADSARRYDDVQEAARKKQSWLLELGPRRAALARRF